MKLRIPAKEGVVGEKVGSSEQQQTALALCQLACLWEAVRSSSQSYFNTRTWCTEAAGGAAPRQLRGRGSEVEHFPAAWQHLHLPRPGGGFRRSCSKLGPGGAWRGRSALPGSLQRRARTAARSAPPSSVGCQGKGGGDGEKLEVKSWFIKQEWFISFYFFLFPFPSERSEKQRLPFPDTLL